MLENNSSLFRKNSLEKVSSPEQLNEYIRVTNPSLIVLLIGIFSIIISGAILMFTHGIPNTVNLSGVVAEDVLGQTNVYCYLPISVSKRLKSGMKVQISPDYADREEYGYINGEILSVGTDIVTNELLIKELKNPQVVVPSVNSAMQSGNVVQIKMNLKNWSSPKGNNIKVTEGTACDAVVVIGETKAYEFIIKS